MQTTSCQLSQGCWLGILGLPRNQVLARFTFLFCQPVTGAAASGGLGGGGAGLSRCSRPARLQPPPAAPWALSAPSHPPAATLLGAGHVCGLRGGKQLSPA